MLKVGAGVVLAVMVTAALAPPSASAQIVPLPLPNVAEALEEIFGAPANLVGEGAAKLAVEAFEGILTALFGFPAKLITKGLLTWLTEVPNFTGGVDPATGRATGSQVAELGRVTSSLAFAAMGAVATVSIIRYWAAGVFQGSGGLEALEGLARTVVAAFAIVLWPWFYGRSVGLANAASSALLGSSEVLENTTALLAAAFRAGSVLNVLTVIVAFAAAILFLGLLLTKIVVSASSVVCTTACPPR